MCGIVGHISKDDVVTPLLHTLRRLEYRGYDSAGICIVDGSGQLQSVKASGKLAMLEAKLGNGASVSGSIGLGHTRWASHGKPSDLNAHPHLDCANKIAVVHNGIIENHAALRQQLDLRGHTFRSETDTEVISHLLEESYSGNPVEAIRAVVKQLQGAYAIGLLFSDRKSELYFARNGASPIVIGTSDGAAWIASDSAAILPYTNHEIVLEEGEIATISRHGSKIVTFRGDAVKREPSRMQWAPLAADKGNYKHYMLKEIFEQPKNIRRSLQGTALGAADFGLGLSGTLSDERIRAIKKTVIVGCGSAYNAGMVGMSLFRTFARLPVEIEFASELRYGDAALDPSTLVVALSQSGETADTLEAVKKARESGAFVAAITNVAGSHLARLSDANIFMRCGPEVGVAATKTYTSQALAITLLALNIARIRQSIPVSDLKRLSEELLRVPDLIQSVLDGQSEILKAAKAIRGARDVLFMGRYVNFVTALEGALKLKEISYIHAEGYAAGEMKHGAIALLDSDVPVIGIATQGRVHDKMLSNLMESRAREAPIIVVAHEDDEEARAAADYLLPVPRIVEELSPLVNVVPLQLLAYILADNDGKDVDQPRNLAKVVTIE